jgi:peroxiredoxin
MDADMTTASPTIADRVDTMERSTMAQMPAEAVATFHREQSRMAGLGVPADVASPGLSLPDIELLDVHGAATSLAGTQAGQPVVLVFYRGAWCPYCNVGLRAYQADLLPTLRERGITLVAVSPQKPDGSLSAQESNELRYPVLSDPGNKLARALGIVTEHGDEAKAAQLGLGLDVAEVNADGTHELPMPTVAIVDGGGVLRWIDVRPDYATRTEVPEIIAGLSTLQG